MKDNNSTFESVKKAGESNASKEFYTFEEILLALRDEYIKNQLLLRKLNEFFVVSGQSLESYQINPKFQEIGIDETLFDKHLYLYVRERVNKLRKTIVKLLNPRAKIIKSIVYDISTSDGNNYSFVKDSINSPSKKLTINITNPIEFDKLVDEILNGEFMSLTTTSHTSMFGGYNLDVDAGQIFCGKFGENVLYDASEDIVQFRGMILKNWLIII